MFDGIRFLFTGRLAAGVTVPWRYRWGVLRGRIDGIDVCVAPEYQDVDEDDWLSDYWWPEDPGELQKFWEDEGKK
jgi:hypothetical protein